MVLVRSLVLVYSPSVLAYEAAVEIITYLI